LNKGFNLDLLAYSNALRFQRLDLECHTEIEWGFIADCTPKSLF
jgi:hypothetical protein